MAYQGYGGSDRTQYASAGTPNYRWWIPAEGIRRDVIQADIQRYLGPEAVVRPGEGRDENRGRNGFWIAAYRTLTPAMVTDLKADSANFERSGDTGRYENSMVHRSRQHWGPTEAGPQDDRASRADSESTQYTQRTAGSYQSSGGQSYSGSQQSYGAAPQSYGHDSRPPREPEPPRHQPAPRDPRDPRDTYAGYGGNQQPGYPPVTSAVSPGDNYTHHSGARQPAVSAPYGYPPQGYERTAPEYAQPRSTTHQSGYPSGQTQQSSGYSTGGHGSHTSSITHQSAAQRAPPGYYLASDGNYYPESSRPTT